MCVARCMYVAARYGMLHNIRRAKNIASSATSDDVFICTAPKTGTTLLQMICHQVIICSTRAVCTRAAHASRQHTCSTRSAAGMRRADLCAGRRLVRRHLRCVAVPRHDLRPRPRRRCVTLPPDLQDAPATVGRPKRGKPRSINSRIAP